MKKKLLITGGAGFIGSHFVRYMLNKYPDYQVVNLDALTYAGNLDNLTDIADYPNYQFVKGDIADPETVERVMKDVDMVVNIAAATHVDRSIDSADPFIYSNVRGTQVLLDAARTHGIERFVQVSTDEVYGDIAEGHFTEASLLRPSNPYSASKAAGDMLCLAYHRTYNFPVIITRCSNNYGPNQYPEKVVPVFVKKLLAGQKVSLYGDGSNVRDWLHVSDHCRAIDMILHKGRVGEIYNISANEEHSNLEITRRLLVQLGLSEDRIEFVTDRPGHDIRYAVDAAKLKNELEWTPCIDFAIGFRETIEWYVENNRLSEGKIGYQLKVNLKPIKDVAIKK
jgi:dTDP-glucose 4,6-dehydratase